MRPNLGRTNLSSSLQSCLAFVCTSSINRRCCRFSIFCQIEPVHSKYGRKKSPSATAQHVNAYIYKSHIFGSVRVYTNSNEARTSLEMNETLNIAHVLVGGLKSPHTVPKTRYYLANFYVNTFLRMTKLRPRAWLKKIFPMPFLII